MKATSLLVLLFVELALVYRGEADARDVMINWEGTGGYRAHISMTYDDAFGSVAAWGGGPIPFGGSPTNQGISQLSVSFYAPLSQQPTFSAQDISDGVVLYRFLNISFDTSARTLFGLLDVGKDSFAE